MNFTGQVFLANVFPASSYNRSVGDLVVFTLAIPLLVLWLYCYLLFVTRMCRIILPRSFKAGYWIVNAMKYNVSAIFRKTGVQNRVQLGNILRNYEDEED